MMTAPRSPLPVSNRHARQPFASRFPGEPDRRPRSYAPKSSLRRAYRPCPLRRASCAGTRWSSTASSTSPSTPSPTRNGATATRIEKVFNPTDFDADQIVAHGQRGGHEGPDPHLPSTTTASACGRRSTPNIRSRTARGETARATWCGRSPRRAAGTASGSASTSRPGTATPGLRPAGVHRLLPQPTARTADRATATIFEVWFDGANGGDGYYGGARETRRIDNRTYYDWPNTWQIVRELQPNAVMFSDAGPDVRWVGNESGIAGDPAGRRSNARSRVPGGPSRAVSTRASGPAPHWLPAECDVSIRPGWFYHPEEDGKVKTPAAVDGYLLRVGGPRRVDAI